MLTKHSLFKQIKLRNNQEDTKLEIVKKYPIEKLCPNKLKKCGSILMGNCPFHEERTPSFAIYPETNSWNCFAGCGGGDVITFYMKLNKCNFETALEALS